MPGRMRLVAANGERAWEIDQPVVTLGRGATVDVLLPDPTVSAQHAIILQCFGELFLQAEETTNGTRLNGDRVAPGSWSLLSPGDRLHLGSLELIVEVRGEPIPGVAVVVLNGAQRGSAFVLTGESLIGRGITSAVRLLDTNVSREHARLWRDEAGTWHIRDLGSKHGTLVNEVRVSEQALRHGDQLTLGSSRLAFLDRPAPRRDTTPSAKGLDELGRPPGPFGATTEGAASPSAQPRARPPTGGHPVLAPGERPNRSAATSPLIGRVYGPYRLLSVIGTGGMGTVFEAEHTELGRHVAIKMLTGQLGLDAAMVQRFFREAQLANEVPHEGIVQIYDCAQTPEGTPYLVMELLRGESLAARLKRVRLLDEPTTRHMGRQIAGVLAAVHAQGIVHRDLKPQNLYLAQRGSAETLKLLDLGIAKALGKEQLTRTGQLIGTAEYLAPEQCLDSRKVDHRADIYALGVILFEMVTGQRPFSGNLFALLHQHLSVAPPQPSKLAEVSPELEAVILRCLSKKPEDRFASCDDVAAAL